MKDSELLKQIATLERSISLLERELVSFEKSIATVPSKELKAKLSAIKRDINKQITEQAKLKIKAYNLINSVTDDISRNILVYRYICFHTVEETAAIIGFSERHTERLCLKALKQIDERNIKKKHTI